MAPSRACLQGVRNSSRQRVISYVPFSHGQRDTRIPQSSFHDIARQNSRPFSTSIHSSAAAPNTLTTPNTNPPTKNTYDTLKNLASSLQISGADTQRKARTQTSNSVDVARSSLSTAMTSSEYAHIARLMSMAPRQKWAVGATYAPHDLSSVEAYKWRQAGHSRSTQRPLAPTRAEFRDSSGRKRMDVIDQLGINPLDEYRNISIMQEFVGPTGRIKHPRETGLRAVNQRKIAKAIRRAVGMGLMSSVHKHPEMMEREKILAMDSTNSYHDRVGRRGRRGNT